MATQGQIFGAYSLLGNLPPENEFGRSSMVLSKQAEVIT